MKFPLKGLQTEIVFQRQNNVSVFELSKKYKVSRQAIYDLLKKAEKSGEKIPWKKPKIKTCSICGKEYFGSLKTCSPPCRSALRSLVNRKENSRWSRYNLIDLKCDNCGKEFKRTKYRQSIAISKKCYKKEVKQNYCSKECYYNRSFIN